MKAHATIQASKSAGMAMTILGAFILIIVVPIFLFASMNFGGVSYLFALVPVGIGLSAVIAGILQFTGKAKLGRVIEMESTIPQMCSRPKTASTNSSASSAATWSRPRNMPRNGRRF
jgi:uncharacterized integral membrane protein